MVIFLFGPFHATFMSPTTILDSLNPSLSRSESWGKTIASTKALLIQMATLIYENAKNNNLE